MSHSPLARFPSWSQKAQCSMSSLWRTAASPYAQGHRKGRMNSKCIVAQPTRPRPRLFCCGSVSTNQPIRESSKMADPQKPGKEPKAAALWRHPSQGFGATQTKPMGNPGLPKSPVLPSKPHCTMTVKAHFFTRMDVSQELGATIESKTVTSPFSLLMGKCSHVVLEVSSVRSVPGFNAHGSKSKS